CSPRITMFEEISFVGLIPIDLSCWHSTNVEAIKVWGSDETIDQLVILRDRGNNEIRPQGLRNLIHRNLAISRERIHELTIGQLVFGVVTKRERRQKIFAPLKVSKSISTAER